MMMAGRAPNVGKVVAMKGSSATGARKESMKGVSGVAGAKRALRGKVSGCRTRCRVWNPGYENQLVGDDDDAAKKYIKR